MDEFQSDLITSYKLETEFFLDDVRHISYVRGAKHRNEKVKEDWSNCGELGKGGFGVVYKQIEKTTGSYRAVKTVDKRRQPKHHYSRELLVMAKLTKYPSLFVEFLGWFEEPGTLYIAMECLGGGDLTNHISAPLPQESVQHISKQILEGLKVMHQQGIAHRDLKPENIFVVSMSPIWVKLGDFGASKLVRAPATTTLHTQVSTPVYSAPEVLGLDSNSETSIYTNSVDIWSLGCVMYELLVGAKLFGSEFQLSGYFLEQRLFPEDKLRGLSPPADEVGISLLKSMLLIQPEDRPTAAGALSHRWLADLKSDNADSEDDQDEVTQSRDESTRSTRSRSELAAHNWPKKRHSEGDLIDQNDIRCIPGDPVGANSRLPEGREPTTPKVIIGTSVTTPSDATSIEISAVQPCPQSRILNAKPTLHTKPVADQNWMSNLDALQPISQSLTHTPGIVSNKARRQATQTNTPTLHLQRTTPPRNPRPTAPAEIAETEIAQPSLYYKILMLGILNVAIIIARILILARIPTLARAFTRVLMPNGTLILEEIKTPGRTERQPRTGLEPSDAGALTRIPMPTKTQASTDSSTVGRTEHRPRTELKLSVAERRREREAIPEKDAEGKQETGEIDRTSKAQDHEVNRIWAHGDNKSSLGNGILGGFSKFRRWKL